MNGGDAPAGREPVLFQYGVYGATLGVSATSASIPASGHARMADFQAKIGQLQASGALPPFGHERLFVVFTQGIIVDDTGPTKADHWSFAFGQYIARVGFETKLSGKTSTASRQMAVSHEIFEAATNPQLTNGWFADASPPGRGEIGDVCTTSAFAQPPYGMVSAVANKLEGNCSIYGRQRLPQTAMVATGPGRVDAFSLDPNRTVVHNSRTTRWSGWESFDFTALSVPTVVSSGPNQLELFAVGDDRSISHKSFDGSVWSPWENVGGLVNGKIAAISRGPGGVDLVVQSVDGGYWHKAHWSGMWFPGQFTWDYLGGVFIGPPAIASDVSTKLYIYGVGLNGQMFQKFWNGSRWLPSGTDWYPLGGTFISPPTITSWGPNRLDLFGLGTNSALFHSATNSTGEWSPWESLGGAFTVTPAVVAYAANRLDIVGQGLDLFYWHKDWNGSTYEPNGAQWEYHGGPFVSAPALTVEAGGLEVSGRDPGQNFLLQGFTATKGWSPSAAGYVSLGGPMH